VPPTAARFARQDEAGMVTVDDPEALADVAEPDAAAVLVGAAVPWSTRALDMPSPLSSTSMTVRPVFATLRRMIRPPPTFGGQPVLMESRRAAAGSCSGPCRRACRG